MAVTGKAEREVAQIPDASMAVQDARQSRDTAARWLQQARLRLARVQARAAGQAT